MTRARPLVRRIAPILAVLPLLPTLWPMTAPDSGTIEWCLRCGELGLSDLVNNLLLFVPTGAALAVAGVRPLPRLFLPVLLSVTIELAQLKLIPGRHAQPSDVLGNTLGAWLGGALVLWWPRRRRSGGAALAASALVLSAVGLASAAFRPSLLRSIYYGQWTAELGHYQSYRGRVLEARIAGMRMRSRRLEDSRAVRAALLRGEPLEVTAVAGPPPPGIAPIFSIYDINRQEIAILGADRGDLVWRLRARAQDWLLRQPELRWPGALRGVAPGDTLSFAVAGARDGHCVTLTRPPAQRSRFCFGYRIGMLWGLLAYPAGWPGWWRTTLAVLAMAGLGFPVGLMFRPGAMGWAALALTLGGAALIPALLGLSVTPWWQLLAVAAGTAAGTRISEPGAIQPNAARGGSGIRAAASAP